MTTESVPQLPLLFRQADAGAARHQRTYLVLSLLTLLSLLIGASAALLPPAIRGWVAVVAFLTALFLELGLLRRAPQRRWQEGRSVAESVRTMAWLYAAGGNPYPTDLPGDEADRLFVRRLGELTVGLDGAVLHVSGHAGAQITDWMREVRESPLAYRKAVYERDRLGHQLSWYSSRARDNASKGEWGSWLALALSFIGLMLGVLHAADVVSVNLFGLVATGATAATAWARTRQYERLSSSYGLAAQDLAGANSLLALVDEESDWAAFVEDAEAAISQEHRSWKAFRH